MPRTSRASQGGYVYHVVDRGLGADHFRGLAGRVVAGWVAGSGAGSRLRIVEPNGLDAEAMAEVNRGRLEREATEL
jgi:hypothetical protein